jgi:hypothetical protein
MNIVLILRSEAVRPLIQAFRTYGVSTPIYDTWSTQLGTSQGAKITRSTLGPEEGTFSARASKAVGRWLRLPGKVLRSVGRSVRLGRWGVCPECRQGVERICRAITKQVQRSDARIEVDVMHTWNECTE